MKLLLSWIVVHLVVATDQSIHFCPVSTALDINAPDHYAYYPVDVFSPPDKLEEETKLSTNCTVIDRSCLADDDNPVYLCDHRCSTTKAFCPVHKTNILETMPQYASGLAKSALCVLRDKLMNASEVINVHITGGSVTAGACTQGCCSAPQCFFGHKDETLCCWSFQFARWLNSTFPAKVMYYNHALGGRDSGGMLSLFRTQWLNEEKFTTNDLFFLDNSVNDNAVCIEGESYTHVAYMLEELFRQLYSMSEPYSLPTIILLDADPKLHLERPNPAYARGYKLAANHYDIPVWSYREAMISDYPIHHQSHYYQYLNFNLSRGTHPGWHIHLLMADLYASILLHDLKNTCTDKNVELQLAFRNRTMKDLPTPIDPNLVPYECGKMILRMNPQMIEKKKGVIGKYHTVPLSSWEVREDVAGRKGTAGFIRQLNSSATIEHDDNAKLIFTLNITTEQLFKKNLSISMHMYIGRSYDNGGLAQVSYCGKNINDMKEPFPGGLMNGLWEDKNYRYSLPFKWSPAPFSPTYCEGFEGKHPTIDITHKMVDPKLIPAEKQKFKVQSVVVCV